MGSARKPADFDAVSHATLGRLEGDAAGKARLYFESGRLGIVVNEGDPSSEFLAFTPETAEEWRDNIDAWVRWRRSDTPAQRHVNHGFCPTHGLAWKYASATATAGITRMICPEGDSWRTVPKTSAIIIPWEEQV